jgi:hypothetical protein
MFGTVRLVPRLVMRFGDTRLLITGLLLAATGMLWMSRLGIDSAYVSQIAAPLVILGFGMGMALAPLTTAGIAGVAPADAGAASGVVNAAHQLGGSLGLSVLVTVFASASRSALAHPAPGASAIENAHDALAHAVASSITGSAILLAAAIIVVIITVLPAQVRGSQVLAEAA